MDHRSMAARLLARLRKETNGAVVADMESRGIHYQRNYGVSQHIIRAAAKELPSDHEFAKYLWQQPVRELKLAAITIAAPKQIKPDELMFWFNGIENCELAENLASFLMSKTGLTNEIIELYGCSGGKFERYAALLSAARDGFIPAEKIITCSEAAVKDGSPMLLRAAGLLISKAAASNDKQLQEYLKFLSSAPGENHKALLNEIMT